MTKKSQMMMEYLNYFLAALALVLVGLVRWQILRMRLKSYTQLLES